MLNLTQHLDKLYSKDLIDDASYVYLKLRSLHPSTMDAPIEDVYYALDYAMGYMEAFYAACKLAQKEFLRIDPFPTLGLRLTNYQNLTEQEVKNSFDTVGLVTYVYNAMQVESSLVWGDMFYVNEDFKKKWNLTTDQLIEVLPKILKLYERFRRTDINDNVPVYWMPNASISPAKISSEELQATSRALNMSNNAYLFWLLQNESLTRRTVDLNTVASKAKINIPDCISTLANLKKAGILTYNFKSIKIIWQQGVIIPALSEMAALASLLKPEAKIMYQLKEISSNLVDVAAFCGGNGLTIDSFYNYLRNLKGKNFLDYSVADFTFAWNYGYYPTAA